VSSAHIIILCRNVRTGELRIDPDMTLYDMDGAKQCLETTCMIYDMKPDAEDWTISIYEENWRATFVEGKE